MGDILGIPHDPMGVLTQLYTPGSVGYPYLYLGAKLKKIRFHNGIWAWYLIPSKYVEYEVKHVKSYMSYNLNEIYKLPSQADNPFSMQYTLELDVTPMLEPLLASYYISLIGIRRWLVELG